MPPTEDNQGGHLQPGWGPAYNDTGTPEPVHPPGPRMRRMPLVPPANPMEGEHSAGVRAADVLDWGTHLAFVHNVLSEFDAADCHGELFWHCGASYLSISFFVNCSDVFHWGTADMEPITPVDVDALCTAFAAAAQAGDISYGPELYAARRRKMRPQGAFYPRRTGAGRAHAANEQMWALFDACGPERPIGVGNPVETPSAGGGDGG